MKVFLFSYTLKLLCEKCNSLHITGKHCKNYWILFSMYYIFSLWYLYWLQMRDLWSKHHLNRLFFFSGCVQIWGYYVHWCWNWGHPICVNLEVCLVSFFFYRIVYIGLFSITIYAITAIAVEPALSTHDRNVSTFKRVIVKDYSQNGRDQLGVSV